MHDISRKISEVVSMYILEDELIDFYVEGITDKLILDNYKEFKQAKIEVIEINNLDFSDIVHDDLDLRSNKHKLIALSRELSSIKLNSVVYCLNDKDLDGILKPIEVNCNLIYTDYSCMEAYFFCEKPIKKFIDFSIRNFPYEVSHIISEISKVLRYLFICELVKEKFEINSKILKIESNLNINRDNGAIEFIFSNYLDKFIIANGLQNKKIDIENFILEIEKTLDVDYRNTMNGHYFFEILFLYINKIKNTVNFKLNTFERAFLVSMQPDYFDDYPLFKLISKYA